MPTTEVLRVAPDAPDPDALARAVEVLRHGGLVAFPTETVYGLGADATCADAVAKIFAAKGRPPTNPLIAHVCDVAMARRFAAHWPDAAERLAAAVWPGPATLVVPKTADIPDLVTAGLDTVGLRVPATAVARALIAGLGRPVAAPSANRSEHVSPTTAEHVLADLDGRIDLVLDSGPTPVGIESTVVDVCSSPPRVLRPGPLDAERLAKLLARPVDIGAIADVGARSPGQHARHYAPTTPAVRVETRAELDAVDLQSNDALLFFGRRLDEFDCRTNTTSYADPTIAARELYGALRSLDAAGHARIVVLMPPPTPAWTAIRDRLVRATTPA